MKRTLDDFAPNRGSKLLLVHCAASSRVENRPPAHARLEQKLGGEFTERVLKLVAGQSRSDDRVA